MSQENQTNTGENTTPPAEGDQQTKDIEARIAAAEARADNAEKELAVRREADRKAANLPPAGQVVADRPKFKMDAKVVKERCLRALERSGRSAELYDSLSDEDRENLATLDKAYPEGSMFEMAVEKAFRAIAERNSKSKS